MVAPSWFRIESGLDHASYSTLFSRNISTGAGIYQSLNDAAKPRPCDYDEADQEAGSFSHLVSHFGMSDGLPVQQGRKLSQQWWISLGDHYGPHFSASLERGSRTGRFGGAHESTAGIYTSINSLFSDLHSNVSIQPVLFSYSR